MNTRALNALAGVICAAQKAGRRTPMGIAQAIAAAQLLQSPETAAELLALRKRVAELEAEVAEERPVDADPIRYTLTAPEKTPASVAADEIRAMDPATVTSCTALTDARLLTLTPRTVTDWRLWVDLLGIDWAQVTHRGGTSTGRGSWNGVPVAVRAVGLSALLLNEAPAEAGESV